MNHLVDAHVAYIKTISDLNQDKAELLERIKRLEEFVDQLTNPKFTRDDLPKEALLQRIKRLEELGHELRECASQLGWTSSDDSRWIERAEAVVEAWDKAKEAKP